MPFLTRVLEPPSYGFKNADGTLSAPSNSRLWSEFLSRINIFRSRKNWLSLFGWVTSFAFIVPLYYFFRYHFTIPLFLLGFVYCMVVLGSYGTFYFHRYGTHRAYQFSHPFWIFIARNLVLKVVPEETYVVSHHVHHLLSEKPGDPYNVHGGFLYCFLADANHQPIARDLSEKDYQRVAQMVSHMGVRINSYAQYQRWGSICHPLTTTLHFVLNWAFWFGVLYLIGGAALATCILGSVFFWALGIRTFNYDGHGGGKDKRQVGIDFNREDLSVNQVWPGYVAGEWHNNHHLYPNGARSGFLPYQLDLPWQFVRLWSRIGAVSSFRDYKADFLRDHYEPYRNSLLETKALSEPLQPEISAP